MRSIYARTTVVEVPTHCDPRTGRPAAPRDLLPWADPYIAQLVARYCRQIADERGSQVASRSLPPGAR